MLIAIIMSLGMIASPSSLLAQTSGGASLSRGDGGGDMMRGTSSYMRNDACSQLRYDSDRRACRVKAASVAAKARHVPRHKPELVIEGHMGNHD